MKWNFNSTSVAVGSVLGLLASILVITFAPGFPDLGWLIMFLVILFGNMLVLSTFKKLEFNWFNLSLIGIYLMLAASFVISTKEHSGNIFLGWAVLSLLNLNIVRPDLFKNNISQWLYIFFFDLIIERIAKLFPTISAGIKDLRAETKAEQGKKEKSQIKYGEIGRTISVFLLLGLPVIVVVVSLLASTSDVFAEWVNNIFNIDWSFFSDQFFRLVFAFMFALGIISEFVFAKAVDNESENLGKQQLRVSSELKNSLHITLVLTVVILNLFYLAFIVAQLGYDFGNLQALISERELTSFSQLAVGRFWELIQVTMINGVILYFAYFFYNKPKDGQQNNVAEMIQKINLTWLVISTMLLIFSTWQRLNLYFGGYGLTNKRFWAYCFLPVLAIVILMLLYSYFVRQQIEVYKLITLILVGFFVLLHILPTGYIINKINYEAAKSGMIQVYDPSYAFRNNKTVGSVTVSQNKNVPKNDVYDDDGLWIAVRSLEEDKLTSAQERALRQNIAQFIQSYEQESDWRNFNFARTLLYLKLR